MLNLESWRNFTWRVGAILRVCRIANPQNIIVSDADARHERLDGGEALALGVEVVVEGAAYAYWDNGYGRFFYSNLYEYLLIKRIVKDLHSCR